MSKTYSNLGEITTDINIIANKNLKTGLFEKDSLLIKGYKDRVIKEEGIIQKPKMFKIKTEKDMYYKNKELLIQANPIAYELNKENERMDLKYLKRKLEASKLKNENLYYDNSKSKEKSKEGGKEREKTKEKNSSNAYSNKNLGFNNLNLNSNSNANANHISKEKKEENKESAIKTIKDKIKFNVEEKK